MSRDPVDLLHAILDSMVKLDLLVFLYKNPDTIDDAVGLSHWIGHDEEAVRRALSALEEVGIVERAGKGPDAVYTWTSDPQVRNAIERFMQERFFPRESRLRLIAEILQREEREELHGKGASADGHTGAG